MRIFQDLYTQTEIISDSYPWVEICEGSAVQIQSRMIIPKDVEVDVGCGNAFGGKNEEEQEGGAASAPVQKINDLIEAFDYQETSFEKKAWQKHFKAYYQELIQRAVDNKRPQEEVNRITKGGALFAKYISKKFDDITIYTPKDFDCTHSLIYSYWKNEEDEAPIFIFYLDGCKYFKV